MYTETEFEKLIKSVETEFSAHLAEVQKNFDLGGETAPGTEALAKAEDGEKKPEHKEKDGKEKKPEAKEAPAAKPEGEAAPEGKEAPAPAAAAPAAEAAPAQGEAAPAPAQGESHDYDAEDLAHMEKMYMSMSPGELKAHHDCIAKIAKCGDMSKAAPEAAPAAAPAAPAAPAGFGKTEVQKSEITSHDKASGGQIAAAAPPHESPGAKSPASKVEGVQMEKSEGKELELAKAESTAKDAKIETLQKSLDAVSAFLTKLVEKKVAPQGKAITSLDVIAKSEAPAGENSLTKSEIDAKLSAKSQDPKLEKSDRDLINGFYLNGGSLNSISHLLK